MSARQAEVRRDGAATTGASPSPVRDALAVLVTEARITDADARVTEVILRLTGEERAEVAVLAALAVAAPRSGDVCLDLSGPLAAADGTPLPVERARELLMTSPAVHVVDAGAMDATAGSVPVRPLVLRGTRLATDRFDRAEGRLAAALRALVDRTAVEHDEALEAALDALVPADAPGASDQRRVVRGAATRGLTVVSGGPGTGKTTTIARLIAVLTSAAGPGAADERRVPRIALLAPTGRAAARLSEAVAEAAGVLPLEPTAREAMLAVRGRTLHAALGFRPATPSRFRHGPERPLPHDVVIVDEASMVPLTLFAALVDALSASARLVVVGDRDQLAAVEAGSVLADVMAAPPAVLGDAVVHLRHAFRYRESGRIGAVAAVLREPDADAARVRAAVAGADAAEGDVELVAPRVGGVPDRLGLGLPDGVGERVVDAFVALAAAATDGADPRELLALVDRLRLLVPLRVGPEGSDELDRRIAALVAARVPDPLAEGGTSALALGRPVLVTRNDPTIDLWNGDVGVVVADASDPEDVRRRRVAFPDGRGGVRTVAPARLPAWSPVHALTVHRAQGGQFDEVVLVLPRVDHPLVTRELVYTGATRARERLTIVADDAVLDAALARAVRRASGLAERLAGA